MKRQRRADDAVGRAVTASALPDLLHALVETLDEESANVIEARFGLRGGQPRTVEDLAVTRGVTIARIQQVVDRATSQMRSANITNGNDLGELRDDHFPAAVLAILRPKAGAESEAPRPNAT